MREWRGNSYLNILMIMEYILNQELLNERNLL